MHKHKNIGILGKDLSAIVSGPTGAMSPPHPPSPPLAVQNHWWRGGSGNSPRGGQPLTLGSLARACLINDTCHSVRREGWVHDV